jgi:hypothetical protein
LVCILCDVWWQWGTTSLHWHKFDNFDFVRKIC